MVNQTKTEIKGFNLLFVLNTQPQLSQKSAFIAHGLNTKQSQYNEKLKQIHTYT